MESAIRDLKSSEAWRLAVAHPRRGHHPQSVSALAGPADEGLTGGDAMGGHRPSQCQRPRLQYSGKQTHYQMSSDGPINKKGNNMNDPRTHDNSEAPRQATNKGEPEDAKAAYEAKQAKDIKESVEKCRSDSEFYQTVKQVKEDRQKDASPKTAPAPESETQGQDNDYYNGMSQ